MQQDHISKGAPDVDSDHLITDPTAHDVYYLASRLAYSHATVKGRRCVYRRVGPHGQDLTRAAVSGHLQGPHVPPPGDTQDGSSSVSHSSLARTTEPRFEGGDEPGLELARIGELYQTNFGLAAPEPVAAR